MDFSYFDKDIRSGNVEHDLFMNDYDPTNLFDDEIDQDYELTSEEVSSIMENTLSDEELLERINKMEEEIEMPSLKGEKRNGKRN